jgi:assimilatory nitrate reductase catalytic subunit
VLWPLPEKDKPGTERFFAEGDFFTADRKACFVETDPPAPRRPLSSAYRFRLNTGRVRDQWHTMTRSGQSTTLAVHRSEPAVEVHPADMLCAGLTDGGFARVTTAYGSCVLSVLASEGQQPGSLFVPIHWSDETASTARVGEMAGADTDPFSGQPELKATPAAIAPVTFPYRGFVLTRRKITLSEGTWWVKVAVAGGFGFLFASTENPEGWSEFARSLFAEDEIAEYADVSRAVYRIAGFRDGRLDGALFVGPAEAAPQWDTAKAFFGAELIPELPRQMLLSARQVDGLKAPGPLICACFGVGLNTIREALASGHAASVEEIGAALRAGTNCGSCLPELKRIVQGHMAVPV